MTQPNRFATTLAGASLASTLFLLGCDPAPPPCPAEQTIAGLCAGVPTAPVCGDDTCTADVDCTTLVDVATAAALASAATTATAGTCLALAPGDYPAVTLSGGVSLLGRGADHVTLAGLTLLAGSGATVRGLTITTGGLVLDGAQTAHVDSVRISGATADALTLTNGASATVTTSTLENAGRYGVFALGSGDLAITSTWIHTSEASGIWMECPTGCDCPVRPALDLTTSIVANNRITGVSLTGAAATLDRVRITATRRGGQYFFGELGGGLSAAACSQLVALGLTSSDNASYGILIDASDALLGQDGEGQGLEVRHNLIGVWVQGATGKEQMHLENALLEDNDAVGIGIAGETQGFIVCRSQVLHTQLATVLNAVGTTDQLGDGIVWLDGAQVTLDEVTLGDNARASLVIDGPVAPGSTIQSLTLTAGDESKGILQQTLPPGGTEPTLGPGVPAPQKSETQQLSIPAPPATPAAAN